MRLVTLIFFVCWNSIYAQTSGIKMEIQPNSIWIGDSAKLVWEVSNAKKVFISHVGSVNPKGEEFISPQRSTVFTLIAESPAWISSKSTVLEVKGSKDHADFPSTNLFSYPLTYKVAEPSYIDFLARCHNTLQNEMGFSLDEHEDLYSRSIVFVTIRAQKSYLLNENEGRIGARRIAYLIEIEKPQAPTRKISYTIKALIEYRRKIERTWRQEKNESLYIEAIQYLNKALAGGI